MHKQTHTHTHTHTDSVVWAPVRDRKSFSLFNEVIHSWQQSLQNPQWPIINHFPDGSSWPFTSLLHVSCITPFHNGAWLNMMNSWCNWKCRGSKRNKSLLLLEVRPDINYAGRHFIPGSASLLSPSQWLYKYKMQKIWHILTHEFVTSNMVSKTKKVVP